MKGKRSDHWHVKGSPLDGRKVPQDWNRMDLTAKRRALVAYGYARDFEHACKVFAKHGGAVRKRRAAMDRAIKEAKKRQG